MTTVTKADLTTALHGNVVVLLDRVGQDIHHHELVTDGSEDMKATWVKRNCCGVFTNWSLPGHLKLPFVPVPDEDVAGGARDDELLTQADIHTSDLFVMEWTMNILTLGRLYISSIKGDIDLQKLIFAIYVVDDVFSRVYYHLSDRILLDLNLSWVLTVARADKVLLHTVDLCLVLSDLIGEDHTIFASKDKSATPCLDTINAHAWCIWHIDHEFTIHIANNDFTLSSSNNELNGSLGPCVASVLSGDLLTLSIEFCMNFVEGAEVLL